MWYMPAPASAASRRAMSAIVVELKTPRSASTPSETGTVSAEVQEAAVDAGITCGAE